MLYHSILDISFCNNHYKKRPPSNELISSNERKSWESVNEHLLKRSKVILLSNDHNSYDDLKESPLAFKLINDYYQNEPNISLQSKIETEQLQTFSFELSPIFFVDDFKLGFSPSDIGLIKFDSKNVQNKWISNPENPREYLITGKDLVENSLSAWDDFMKFAHHTKSIIISDNYIFSNKDNIKTNFIPLLKSLIPKSIKYDIELLIITEKLFPINPFEKDKSKIKPIDLNDLYKEVKDIIKHEIPYAKINITMVKKHMKKNHDRNIITNYFRMEFSNSLSFFSRNGKKIGPSHVKLYPMAHIFPNGNVTFGHNTTELLSEIKCVYELVDPANIVNPRPNSLLQIV